MKFYGNCGSALTGGRAVQALRIIVTVILTLTAGVLHSNAQTPSTASSLQAALQEAKQLDEAVVRLYGEGKYREAEAPAERALVFREQALGPHHPDIATSLNNLALLYQAQGAYAKAEPLYVRALAICEQALGRTHPDVATSLNNLAELYQAQGAYAKAEPLLVRALAIRESALGPNHPDVATSLNNLAELYQAQGAYTKAELLLVRALAISEQALGPSHPDVGKNLNNLALLYKEQGAYANAEPLSTRSLAIREQALGSTHPDVAQSLNGLADLYRRQGAYAKAEPLLVRSLAIFEQALGPSHPDVATNLNNLAALYQAQGAYAKAEPLLVRALAIRERALGPTHPDVATSLNNLAEVYWAQGTYAKTEGLYRRAADIAELRLRAELERLSEPRRRALMVLAHGETQSLVSFHADAVPGRQSALDLALTTVLRREGRVVDSLADSQTHLRAHLIPALQQQLDELLKARGELVARLYVRPGAQSAVSAQRAAIEALRSRVDELEAKLNATSDQVPIQTVPVTIAAVQAQIPADAALVELVRYQRFDPRQPQPWQEARYVAYLLTQDGPARWVALGEAQPIDAAVDTALATMDDRIPVKTARAALQQLNGMLLAPIRAQLPAGIAHLIVAPDGKLNLVPFEALIDPEGHYALDRYLVSYVSSGRDLLRLALTQRPQSSAVLIAAPDYGPPPSSKDQPSFLPVPGEAAEASDLQRYFPTAALTGKNATKAALAGLIGPAIVHIATHGFYDWRVGNTTAPARRAADETGLAMAGANQGPVGIVTAREIAGFDWTGTQLVVLSACQTGAVASGDGVYGLRDALVMAGAASQVVSLWNVADAATVALMRDYYAALRQGAGRAEALRQAKQQLVRHDRYAHPFYWAAFVAAGDWRPLAAAAFAPQRSTP